jgi:hypothetical protein
MGGFQSGQMGRTVNPLSYDFSGSNPLLPTFFERVQKVEEVRDFFKLLNLLNQLNQFFAEVAHLVER